METKRLKRTLSIDKEGKRLIVPTQGDGTLYQLAMVAPLYHLDVWEQQL